MTDAAWTPACPVDDVREGRACVRVGERSIVLIDTADGVRALLNECPHAGLPLDDGEVAGQTITCPYHGFRFSLRNGKDLDDPEFGIPATLFPVRERDGQVEVQLPSPETPS